ncbi:MAG: superoxide dismutase [Muribaculaceae bacterium]|nr:superoxide dismutase [Muribaculaceae bacterium]
MKYTQPDLPYDINALEPTISERTVDFHYGKHEKAYIDNLNKLIKGTEYEDMELEEIIEQAPEGALLNNASQAWNHIFYFFTLSPDGGGKPTGRLAQAIDRDFGSFDEFKKAFVDAGIGLFGSGWVWLASDSNGKLFIIQGLNAQNPLRDGLQPLLTFDVWEHAYYLDYQNRRADALNKLWDIVDWSIIESRY